MNWMSNSSNQILAERYLHRAKAYWRILQSSRFEEVNNCKVTVKHHLHDAFYEEIDSILDEFLRISKDDLKAQADFISVICKKYGNQSVKTTLKPVMRVQPSQPVQPPSLANLNANGRETKTDHASISTERTCPQSVEEDLKMEGILAIQKYIAQLNCVDRMRLSVENDGIENNNPVFCYVDDPLIEWRREVPLKLKYSSNKGLRSATEVVYVPSDGSARINNGEELRNYLNESNMPLDIITKFDFSRVLYCVCHQPSEKNAHGAKFIKCAFGKCSCNGWMHTSCVGLDRNHSHSQGAAIVCPFCTAYLNGSGEAKAFLSQFPGAILLSNFTAPISRDTLTTISSMGKPAFDIWASHKPPPPRIVKPQERVNASEIIFSDDSRDSVTIPQSRKTAVAASPSLPSGIFQHRLLMDLMNPATIIMPPASKEEKSQLLNKKKRSAKSEASELPRREERGDTKVDSEDEFIVNYPPDYPLVDRVRKFRRLDGRIENIRIVGGWMRKSESTLTDIKDGNAKQRMPSEDDDKQVIREKILKKLENRPIRMLLQARRSLLQRQRQLLLDRAVAKAVTGANSRRKGAGTNYQAADWTIFPSDGRRSTLCHLPAEDGGLRLASVSHVVIMKSIHPWCCSQICAYCLQAKDYQHPSARKDDFSTGLTLVEESFGVVSYSIHVRCQVSLQRYTADNRKIDDVFCALPIRSPHIECLNVYEYGRVEDAECDLCGLKGGIMQYFAFRSDCCSLKKPSSEGWLAHTACCFYLSKSGCLTPFTQAAPASVRHYLSCVTPSSGSAASPSVDVPAIASDAPSEHLKHPKEIIDAVNYMTIFVERSFSLDIDGDHWQLMRTEVRKVLNDLIAQLEGSLPEIAVEEEDKNESKGKSAVVMESPAFSLFDLTFRRWRCSLCGLHGGFTVRCSAVTCTVRCHPVCAYLSSIHGTQHNRNGQKEWMLCSSTTKGDCQGALIALCPMHSISKGAIS